MSYLIAYVMNYWKKKLNSWINQIKLLFWFAIMSSDFSKITDAFHSLFATKCKLCWEVK